MSKSNTERMNYATDILGIPDIGPGSAIKLIRTHLRYLPKKPLLLVGEPGVGKTAITMGLEVTENCVIHTVRLANEDEGTMNGYADADKDAPTVTLRIVRKVYEAAEKAKAEDKRLIVMFDEINRAKEHMIKYVFNIVDTRRWGDYLLPDNTSFIVAINPPTVNHKVKDVLADSAFRRRYTLVSIAATADEYLDYAASAGIHKAVIAFIRSKPVAIYDYVSLDNNKPYACPASWDAVSNIIKGYELEGKRLATISKDINVMRILVGIFGEGMTVDFLQFVEDLTQRLSPENVIKNYGEIRPDILEALNAETSETGESKIDVNRVATMASNVGLYVADLIVTHGVMLYVSEEEVANGKISKKNADRFNNIGKNFATFLNDLPADVFRGCYSGMIAEVKRLAQASDDTTKTYPYYTGVINQMLKYPEYKACASNITTTQHKMASATMR